MNKILTYLLVFCCTILCKAQHNYPVYSPPDSIVKNAAYISNQASVFVHAKIKKLNKFADKENKHTKKLLKKLSRKEKKFLSKVERRDSLSLQQLGKTISFDSLRNEIDSSATGKTYKNVKNSFSKTVDSLKKISAFANEKINYASDKLNQNGISTNEIDALQQKLNANEYLQKQIQERAGALQSLGKTTQYTTGLKSISKQTFYFKQKLNAYKSIANDPSVLEEKALDYLKGMEGFEESFSAPSLAAHTPGQGASMQQAKSAEELEKMGYQTKRQVKAQMDKQFGMKTPEQIEQVNAKFKEAKSQFANYKNQLSSTKEQIKKLGFKPNPLRGLPLKNRVEKSLNWQVYKATNTSPALFEMNGMLGFKHTPALTHSLVFGSTLGLGKNWQHIHFSFEGLRVGVNTDMKFIWGISGQAGFERVYKQYTQTKIVTTENNFQQVITYNKYYSDIAYCGLQKTYKINSKYSGTILLAYDFLWKQGNAKTPVIWRAGWKK